MAAVALEGLMPRVMGPDVHSVMKLPSGVAKACTALTLTTGSTLTNARSSSAHVCDGCRYTLRSAQLTGSNEVDNEQQH
jgi:hypothetical protein